MKKINKFFRNIDLRKFFGTIIGGAFFLCCVAYFTYAYYEWKSDETSIALTIQEADVKCTMGPNVDVSNIGPVLKLRDGVKASFAIENSFTDDMAISVILDITSISNSLLNESFKWAIVQENESNFDYNNPIIEGSFKNFREGSNLITTALQVPSQQTANYEFIVYIDGNMKNDISMMQNSMEASLTLGNCGTDYIRYDELTQFAFYSADDNSLTFTFDYPVAVGDTYQGKTVTNLYTGYDTTKYNSASAVPWYSDGNYDDIRTVTFLSTTTPTSTAYWFNGFKNANNIDLAKLDTSNVTTMRNMFAGCNSLVELDVSEFNTSNVTNMYSMFAGCRSLVELDVSNFDTSNVTQMNPNAISYDGMFYNCSSLTSLDLSNFDTSKIERFSNMFMGCSNLKTLDLSNFNTSNAKEMGQMFKGCVVLVELDVSNFDTSSVTNMGAMFFECKNLTNLDVSNFDTSKVTNMGNMFENCGGLTKLDVSNFDTSNVTGLGSMFNNCSNLIKLDVSNFDTSNVTIMEFMFGNCSSLTSLDLSNFDTSNVTTMRSMFFGCRGLTAIDVSNFDTSNVKSMRELFRNTNFKVLDLSNFDTSNVTDMFGMFQGCSNLVNINLSSFDTSNVTNMNYLFYGSPNLNITLTIMNPNTSYSMMLSNNYNLLITLYYVGDNPETTDINESTYDLVEAMVATGGKNVINGGCKGDYCTNV